MPNTACVPDFLVSILQQKNSGAELLVESNVCTVAEKFYLECPYLCLCFLFVCLFEEQNKD